MTKTETPKKTPKNLKRKKEDEQPQQEEQHQSDDSVEPASKKARVVDRNYQASIHILNLDETTTEQSLREFFDECGSIVHVFMFKRYPQGKKVASYSAQIEFSSPEEASTARGKDKQTLDGRTIHVKEAHAPVPPQPTDQIRIAGLDKSTTANDVRAALAAYQSNIVEVVVPTGEDGAGRGFALVKLDGVEPAQQIFTSFVTPINGAVPRIYYQLEKPPVEETRPRRESTRVGRGGASRGRGGAPRGGNNSRGRGGSDRGGRGGDRGGRGGDRGGRGGRGGDRGGHGGRGGDRGGRGGRGGRGRF